MDLFDDLPLAADELRTPIAPGAVLLRGLGRADDVAMLAAVETVIAQAPLRHMQTPGGHTMSIQTSRCGSMGWVSEPGGYRYAASNPQTRQPWPAIPPGLVDFAVRAAAEAGYPGFVPDSCLINQYLPGNKLGLHQDRDERDLRAPVVSLSLGLPATFLFGGLQQRPAEHPHGPRDGVRVVGEVAHHLHRAVDVLEAVVAVRQQSARARVSRLLPECY